MRLPLSSKKRTLVNSSRNRDIKYVSIKTNVKIPEFIKNSLSVLTSTEQSAKNRGASEIVSQYSAKFDKRTMKVYRVESGHNNRNRNVNLSLNDIIFRNGIRRIIEKVVKINLANMIPSQRSFVFSNWNGEVIFSVKKLVLTGNRGYMIGWHRDAYDIQLFGKRAKGFAVGALYVNRPRNTRGGEIFFARNRKRFGLAPPSGTSVTFFDDEIFHKVTPVQFINGSKPAEYVPRSGFFFAYMTSDLHKFKPGIQGVHRNYEAEFRRISSTNQRVPLLLNRNSNIYTNLEKIILSPLLREWFKNQNLNTNQKIKIAKSIYKNLKGEFNNSGNPVSTSSSFITFPKSVKKRQIQRISIKRKMNIALRKKRLARARKLNRIS